MISILPALKAQTALATPKPKNLKNSSHHHNHHNNNSNNGFEFTSAKSAELLWAPKTWVVRSQKIAKRRELVIPMKNTWRQCYKIPYFRKTDNSFVFLYFFDVVYFCKIVKILIFFVLIFSQYIFSYFQCQNNSYFWKTAIFFNYVKVKNKALRRKAFFKDSPLQVYICWKCLNLVL